MAVKLTIEAEERPWKAIVKIAAVLLFAALCFAVAAVVSLAALHLFHNGWEPRKVCTDWRFTLINFTSSRRFWPSFTADGGTFCLTV